MFPLQVVYSFDKKVKTVSDITTGRTFQQALRWVERNVWYKSDFKKWRRSDYWQTPEETLTKDSSFGERTGDCEDYAILCRAILKEYEIPSQVLRINGVTNRHVAGHAVCIFEHTQRWWYIDNGVLLQSSFQTKDKLIEYIKSQFGEF